MISIKRRRRIPSETSRRTRIIFSAGVASALAAAVALTLAPAAAASPRSAGTVSPATLSRKSAVVALSLRPMPVGTVAFGRGSHGRLEVLANLFGLTPGSPHRVDLVLPGRPAPVQFGTLTANSVGQADSALRSAFTGQVPHGSRLLIRMGAGRSRVARAPIAVTRPLGHLGRRPHRLIAVEVSSRGLRYGTPSGRATISYSARRHTLTVTVSASGVTPGPHAAHIHLGSCQSQGPVKYMLRDLIANRHGRIMRAIRVFTHVTSPIPATGWYLNIHQGNSRDILRNGQPTIFFRPLICANIAH